MEDKYEKYNQLQLICYANELATVRRSLSIVRWLHNLYWHKIMLRTIYNRLSDADKEELAPDYTLKTNQCIQLVYVLESIDELYFQSSPASSPSSSSTLTSSEQDVEEDYEEEKGQATSDQYRRMSLQMSNLIYHCTNVHRIEGCRNCLVYHFHRLPTDEFSETLLHLAEDHIAFINFIDKLRKDLTPLRRTFFHQEEEEEKQ